MAKGKAVGRKTAVPATAVRKKEGRKTINLSLTFWTDGIAEDGKDFVPKTCWDYGTVRVKTNEMHGIEGGKTKHFGKFANLQKAIEKAMKGAGITLLEKGTCKPHA